MNFTADAWPICPHCGREFRYLRAEGIEPPDCCGEPFCCARQTWTPEQWAGRARMARAHRAAGGQLSEWDREALQRETGKTTW
jgi:hypothetical protein